MKILDGLIDWWADYGNSPNLVLRVDRLTNRELFRYEKRRSTSGLTDLYFAEHEGEVRFFSWDGRPGDGFGGSKIPITMKDGSTVELLGPWSSSESSMMAAGFPPCVHVTLDPLENRHPGLKYAGTVTLALLEEALPRIHVGPLVEKRDHKYRADRGGPLRLNQEFPPGTTCTLVKAYFGGNDAKASAEQRGVLDIMAPVPPGAEFYYEPAALLPDGSVWRKPR